MEHYMRKLQDISRHARLGDAHMMRKAKKLLLAVVIVCVLFFIGCIILLIMAISWLVNRGGDSLQQAGQSVATQAEQLRSPLNLESFISNGQVDTAQLEKTFNALPGMAQDVWPGQFKTQLDELRQQAGVSDETIQSLTATYDSLVRLQNL